MGPLVSRWYERTAVACSKLVAGGPGSPEAERTLRGIAEEAVPMADRRTVASLVRAGMAEFRRLRRGGRPGATFALRELEKAANRADREMQLKAKGQMIAESLSLPCVFYAVSTHQKPRCQHRDMQGQILYDRNFRQKGPWYEARQIERFVRQNDMMSVQEAVRGPKWLITSPYCRHRLFPLDTQDVLHGTANTYFPDGSHRSRTDAQRAKEYRDRRRRIAVRLQGIYKK